MQIVCIMVQLITLHPKTPSSLAPFKSRLVLPFWYRLTWVVSEKGPLNGCVCVCTHSNMFFGVLDSEVCGTLYVFGLWTMMISDDGESVYSACCSAECDY